MQDLLLADSQAAAPIDVLAAKAGALLSASSSASADVLMCAAQLVLRDLSRGRCAAPLLDLWLAAQQQQQRAQDGLVALAAHVFTDAQIGDAFVCHRAACEGVPALRRFSSAATAGLARQLAAALEPPLRSASASGSSEAAIVRRFFALCELWVPNWRDESDSPSSVACSLAALLEADRYLLRLRCGASAAASETAAAVRILCCEVVGGRSRASERFALLRRSVSGLRLRLDDVVAGHEAAVRSVVAAALAARDRSLPLLAAAEEMLAASDGAGSSRHAVFDLLVAASLLEMEDAAGDDDNDDVGGVAAAPHRDLFSWFAAEQQQDSDQVRSFAAFVDEVLLRRLPVADGNFGVRALFCLLLCSDVSQQQQRCAVANAIALLACRWRNEGTAADREAGFVFISSVASRFVMAASAPHLVVDELQRAVDAVQRSADAGDGGRATMLPLLAEHVDVLGDLLQRVRDVKNATVAPLASFAAVSAAVTTLCQDAGSAALVYGAALRGMLRGDDGGGAVSLLQVFAQVACAHLMQRGAQGGADSSAAAVVLLLEGCIEPLLLLRREQHSAATEAIEAARRIARRQLLPHLRRLAGPSAAACGDLVAILLRSDGDSGSDVGAAAAALMRDEDDKAEGDLGVAVAVAVHVRDSVAAWIAPRAFSPQLLARKPAASSGGNGNGGGAVTVQCRLALLALQRAEAADRSALAAQQAAATAALGLPLWCSAHLQLHIESARGLLADMALDVVRPAVAEAWFRHCCEERRLLGARAVESAEQEQRAACVELPEAALRSNLLAPLLAGTHLLLLEEAAERAPLGRAAAGYSSASWLFEEERVVRAEVVADAEAEERAALLAPALERLRFCVGAERALRAWAEGAVLAQEHPLLARDLPRSVVAAVLAPQDAERRALWAAHALLREVQQAREDVEAAREEGFFFLQRLRRLQERWLDECMRARVQAWAECSAALHAAFIADALEPHWEEGIDAVYQQRDEAGAELLSVLRKRGRQHPVVVAAAVANTAATVRAPPQESVAAEAKPAVQPTVLPAHVARSLRDTEASMRHDLVCNEIDARERVAIRAWSKLGSSF